MPSCKRCGKKDPQRMHGLMSLWFGPLVELEADLGYFYLCPTCHDELIVPELERIQNRILELHPAAQRHVEELEPAQSTTNDQPPGRGGAGDQADTADDDAADDDAPDDDAPDDDAPDDDAPDARSSDNRSA